MDDMFYTDAMKFLSIQLPLELLAAIDEYRYAHKIPSRVEAIRRLLLKALGGIGGKEK